MSPSPVAQAPQCLPPCDEDVQLPTVSRMLTPLDMPQHVCTPVTSDVARPCERNHELLTPSALAGYL